MAETSTFIEQFNDNPFHQYLGVTLVEQRAGYGRIKLTRSADTPTGIGGSVHGGVLASLVDIAMLVAIFAEMRAGEEPAGTAELGITYLRPAMADEIFASARVIKRGRQLSLVEVDITDSDERLCARGRTLYAFRA